MQFEAWSRAVEDSVARWWFSLSYDDLRAIWIAAGVVLAIALLWFSHWIMRRALGYRKFRGTWYSERQWQELINQLDADLKSGHRVMRHDEMQILRLWRFGDDRTFSVKGYGYK